MNIRQTLRRPSNWDDFETLCHKLWGELWKCPEIKKHGRPGQKQFGVDVYGRPFNADGIYGIQCKAKNENLPVKLTIREIDDEVKNALEFKPSLKKLYFATTADKDITIEEYVRLLNEKHINQGLFEVHIFDWEDITEFIDTAKATQSWYLRHLGYSNSFGANVTLNRGDSALTLKPVFYHIFQTSEYNPIGLQYQLNHLNRVVVDRGEYNDGLHEDTQEAWTSPQPVTFDKGHYSLDPRYCISKETFRFTLHNSGSSPLKNPKVRCKIVGDFLAIERLSKQRSRFYFPPGGYNYDVHFDSANQECVCDGSGLTVVPGDSYTFDSFCIKTFPTNSILSIEWKLLSEDYSADGTIKLAVEPTIITQYRNNPTIVESSAGEVKEYFKHIYVTEDEYEIWHLDPNRNPPQSIQ